ncbi:MAG: hypothetical protein CL670_03155 [Balneola sp.]|jgi:hypothetical protein|nr:hypothetical protein [Balneola sp.]MBE78131.1 hypothetical protein [Balneola sp.]|tara:strand:- start:146 stop:691 length:546 start_codon:yes stop_codon:yes gene_type:complete
MKKQFFITSLSVLLLIIITNPVFGQQVSSLNKYWFQTGLGGSPEGLSIALGASLQSGKLIGTIKAEASSQLLFPESSALATAFMVGTSLQKPSNNSERSLSLNLQAGVGTFTFEECVESCGILSSPDPKNSRETAISFPINAQMLAILSKNIGFGFETGAHFNSIKIYASLHFTVIVGKFR